jgi:hypothetical protein
VFENRVLRSIFGPKRDEVTQQWRKFNKEASLSLLLTQYCGSYKIEKNEMGEACSLNGEKIGVYRSLLGKSEGKRPLGRPRHIWEDNIKMDLQEVGCGVWTGFCWLRIETGGGHV